MYVIYNIVMEGSSEEFIFTEEKYNKIIRDIETLKDRNNRIIMNMVSNSSISDSMPGVGMLKAAGKKLFGIAVDKLWKTKSTDFTGTNENYRDITPKFFVVDPSLVDDRMQGYTRDFLYNTNGKRVEKSKGTIFGKMLGLVDDNKGDDNKGDDNKGGAKRRRKSSYRKSYRKSRKHRRTRRR